MTSRPAAVVLGSAFARGTGLGPLALETVSTVHGAVPVYRHPASGGVVVFRHGRPHRYLPHQVPWRAQAAALRRLNVRALLLTSSVGVLDPTVPLYTPHLAGDLVMPDNRLPDGSMCTMWPEPHPEHGHLVVDRGLFDARLGGWLGDACGLAPRRLVFAYVPGPRTKTAAENRLLRGLGVEVNSMSIGPEVVLANELEIPTVALLTGHKASAAGGPDAAAISRSLDEARAVQRSVVERFLAEAPTVPFGNLVYRFDTGSEA